MDAQVFFDAKVRSFCIRKADGSEYCFSAACLIRNARFVWDKAARAAVCSGTPIRGHAFIAGTLDAIIPDRCKLDRQALYLPKHPDLAFVDEALGFPIESASAVLCRIGLDGRPVLEYAP